MHIAYAFQSETMRSVEKYNMHVRHLVLFLQPVQIIS